MEKKVLTYTLITACIAFVCMMIIIIFPDAYPFRIIGCICLGSTFTFRYVASLIQKEKG
jgi:hypothetical protein